MFTVVHKGSWRQAKMDVTWLNSVLCLSIYSECDDDCAFSTCWVVGEWKKGRCHMSSPDLCSQGKKISWTQFSTLSSVINKQFTRTPKQATIFQPSIVCHPVSSQRQPLTPASSQHIQGSEVILVWWRVTLLKNTCGAVFWDHGIMSAKHGKSLLISSLFSSTSCFLLERVNDWLNTLMILHMLPHYMLDCLCSSFAYIKGVCVCVCVCVCVRLCVCVCVGVCVCVCVCFCLFVCLAYFLSPYPHQIICLWDQV